MTEPSTPAEAAVKTQSVCPNCKTDARGAVMCPGCGANLTYKRLVTRVAWDGRGSRAPVVIRGASYYGGHPLVGEQRLRNLEIVVDDNGWRATQSVAVDNMGRETREVRFSIGWESIKTVQIEVGDRHAVAGRLLVAGVVGALSSKRKVFLVIETTGGEAFFELHSRHPERIRAQLSPWITAAPKN